MSSITIGEAWDRVETAVKELSEGDVEITRKAQQFGYRFDMGAHSVTMWAVGDSPRYCVNIDTIGMRFTNIKALMIVVRMMAQRPVPWESGETWDE